MRGLGCEDGGEGDINWTIQNEKRSFSYVLIFYFFIFWWVQYPWPLWFHHHFIPWISEINRFTINSRFDFIIFFSGFQVNSQLTWKKTSFPVKGNCRCSKIRQSIGEGVTMVGRPPNILPIIPPIQPNIPLLLSSSSLSLLPPKKKSLFLLFSLYVYI